MRDLLKENGRKRAAGRLSCRATSRDATILGEISLPHILSSSSLATYAAFILGQQSSDSFARLLAPLILSQDARPRALQQLPNVHRKYGEGKDKEG